VPPRADKLARRINTLGWPRQVIASSLIAHTPDVTLDIVVDDELKVVAVSMPGSACGGWRRTQDAA
jgi:hypothetical protein